MNIKINIFFSKKYLVAHSLIFTLDAQSKLAPRAANTSSTSKLSLHFTAEIKNFLYTNHNHISYVHKIHNRY